jgi:H(+)-transporting ATP synthase subunit D
VTRAATRWQLIQLQRRRRAIETGADLLDRKREALLRALATRARATADRRTRLAAALAAAYRTLGRALVEIGELSALAATAAQPRTIDITAASDAVVGVRVPRLIVTGAPPAPQYGPGGTSAALDAAVTAFGGLLEELVRVAEDEAAERSLKRGLRRTVRTLNALRTVLLPAVDAGIRAVAAGLEEEERDEAVRWRLARS